MSGMTGVQLAGSVEGQWQHLPVIRATDLRSLVGPEALMRSYVPPTS
jgi:hypothetical protein